MNRQAPGGKGESIPNGGQNCKSLHLPLLKLGTWGAEALGSPSVHLPTSSPQSGSQQTSFSAPSSLSGMEAPEEHQPETGRGLGEEGRGGGRDAQTGTRTAGRWAPTSYPRELALFSHLARPFFSSCRILTLENSARKTQEAVSEALAATSP